MRTKLFHVSDLASLLGQARKRAVEKANTMDPDRVRLTPDDVIAELIDEFEMPALVADWDAMMRDTPRETTLVRSTPWGEPVHARGIAYTFHVPLQGEWETAVRRASTWNSGYPLEGGYEGGNLTFDITVGSSDDANSVKTQLDRYRRDFDQLSSWTNSEISQSNAALRAAIDKTIRQRKQSLIQAASVSDELGIPIRPVAPEKQLIIPVKRTTIRVAKESSGHGDPKVTDAIYEDVLRTISSLGRSFERLPATAAKFDEEELRDLILFFLNANYEGSARGEVFNGSGKTDLLIPYENQNAFIGECKVWRGPKAFTGAIDQLLGYTVWRDTKGALILFIENKHASKVIEAANKEIREHRCFVKALEASEPDLRRDYLLHHIDDPERNIRIAFLPIVIRPSERSS